MGCIALKISAIACNGCTIGHIDLTTGYHRIGYSYYDTGSLFRSPPMFRRYLALLDPTFIKDMSTNHPEVNIYTT